MNDDVGKIADMTDSKIRDMEKLREEAEQATGSIASRVRGKKIVLLRQQNKHQFCQL
jgi:hypothetical protein